MIAGTRRKIVLRDDLVHNGGGLDGLCDLAMVADDLRVLRGPVDVVLGHRGNLDRVKAMEDLAEGRPVRFDGRPTPPPRPSSPPRP
jgi:hypothetical protein